MTAPSRTLDMGVLKRTLTAEWFISPKHLRQNRGRSGIFSSEVGSHCLLLVSESDLPGNMSRFNVWLYSRGIVKRTLDVNLSLLDYKNQQCYAVEKRLINSTSETRKVCATVDFSIIPHHTQKFFHDGALRIQCCIDTLESVASNSKPSRDDFNKLEALLQTHMLDIQKAGVLAKRDIFTWTISAITMRNEVEVKSEQLICESSEFRLSIFNSAKSKKLNERFEICLTREPQSLPQNIRVTLAVLDNKGIMHYTKEEVTQDSCKVFLNSKKALDDREFLEKGKFKIYCSLQIDNSSTVSDFAALKSDVSSEPLTMVTVSSPPTENAANVESTSSEPSQENKLIPFPVNKQLSKSVGNTYQKLVAKNPNMFCCTIIEKSKLEGALNELLKLIHDARVDALFASTIISILFNTAKDDYKGTITKVLLNLVLENNYPNETDLQMISRNMGHISVTDQWLAFLKSDPELANVVVQRLAIEK